jgi:hypothetical protein
MAGVNDWLTKHPFLSGLLMALGMWAGASGLRAGLGMSQHLWLSLAILVAMSPAFGFGVRSVTLRKRKP